MKALGDPIPINTIDGAECGKQPVRIESPNKNDEILCMEMKKTGKIADKTDDTTYEEHEEQKRQQQ